MSFSCHTLEACGQDMIKRSIDKPLGPNPPCYPFLWISLRELNHPCLPVYNKAAIIENIYWFGSLMKILAIGSSRIYFSNHSKMGLASTQNIHSVVTYLTSFGSHPHTERHWGLLHWLNLSFHSMSSSETSHPSPPAMSQRLHCILLPVWIYEERENERGCYPNS